LVARHFFVRSFVGSSGLLVVRWCLLVLVRVRWCLSLFVVFSRSVIRLKPSEPSFGLFHPSLSVLSVQSQSHDVASSERRQTVRLLGRPSFVIVLSKIGITCVTHTVDKRSSLTCFGTSLPVVKSCRLKVEGVSERNGSSDTEKATEQEVSSKLLLLVGGCCCMTMLWGSPGVELSEWRRFWGVLA